MKKIFIYLVLAIIFNTNVFSQNKIVASLSKLQGTWFSVEDHNYRLKFSNTLFKEYYEKELVTTSTIKIVDSCNSNKTKARNASFTFFSVYDGKSIICYEVVFLNKYQLELINLDANKVIRFKRN